MKPSPATAAPYGLSWVLLLPCVLALPGLGRAEAPDDEAWRKQIAELESRLFEPSMAVDEVQRLLGELKQTDTRANAAKRLAAQGQGRVGQVIAFARDCPDMDVRQACADVVEALDASYRTSALGRRLAAIYYEHTETLLPPYWARFRKDPLDPRAVAMLMHADAEKAYAALGKTADRHDQVRYLLLRMRELTPDEFARQHIFQHTASGARLVLAEVVPDAGCRRIVGHAGLARITVGTYSSNQSGLPKIDYLNVCRRTVYAYSYQSSYSLGNATDCAVLAITPHNYSPKAIRQDARAVRSIDSLPERMCPLPKLVLSRDLELAWMNNNTAAPWWAKPYVPPAYEQQAGFGRKPAGAIAPDVVREDRLTDVLAPKSGLAAAKTDSSAPAAVFLPPRFHAPPAPQAEPAAELACDRLAQEIAAAGLARVVDRTQLAGLLRERELATGPSKPMSSYDAMLRMDVDNARMPPETRLSVIDLSTGNVLAQRAFGWPLHEADAAPMTALCREALQGAAKPAGGKLRVRTLWAPESIGNERIRPLGRRLIELFDESLRRSERVLLVRHLEAATSKEESLLLLLGLSRLPGGRQFTPQADATIELRVVEGDGRGKTFPLTPVEIGVRLRKGTGYEGQWVTTAGLIRDFDALLPQAWQKLAQSLGEVRAETATALLNEMSLRRKQAEAELQAAQKLLKSGPRPADPRRAEALMAAALAHTEAAVKLDPTHAGAVCAHMDALRKVAFEQLRQRARDPKAVPSTPLVAIREAERYLEQFRRDGGVCTSLCASAAFCLQYSPLNALYGLNPDGASREPVAKSAVALTPECVQALNAVKQLLERGVEDDVSLSYADADRMMAVAFHGMKFLGVPAVERQAWLDKIGRRCRDKIKRGVMEKTFPDSEWNQYVVLQLHRAELMMEDGQLARAKEIVVQVQAEMPAGCQPWASVAQLMRAVIATADDAQLLADLDRWLERGKKQQVHRLWIKWPTLAGFPAPQDRAAVDPQKIPKRTEPVEVRAGGSAAYRNLPRHRPLAEGDGRLYFLVSSLAQKAIACVPVDQRGRPVGKAVPNEHGTKMWDNVKSIPQPAFSKESRVASARYIDGKLYLGMGGPFPDAPGAGLWVFDPKAETWKSYGPEQGLPASAVEAFFPISEQMLYCASSAGHYTLNLATGAVTLVHRGNEPAGRLTNNELRLLWRDGERLMAVSESGVWSDLLGKAPTRAALSHQTGYGWRSDDMHLGIVGAAEAAGRRFYCCRGGLYEIDAAGKTIGAWWTQYQLHPAGSGTGVNTGLQIVAPADCPITGLPTLHAVGSRLVLTDSSTAVIYDPPSDTWYEGSCCQMATPSGGLWTTTLMNDGLRYLSIDDVIDDAKAAGRVLTTAEYRRRKQQFIDAAKPLERAKFALGMRQFDNSKSAFQQVLDADPHEPEALLLMGFLHDRNCLNQPDEAVKYYRQAADLKDNPPAAYTGMYLWLCVLKNRQQWKDASELCEQVLQRYPGLEERERQHIQWLRAHSRQQLAGKDAKQPAAGTSHQEESPAQ
jgi:hypothetical protein